jgi:phosphatidylglycerol---prolipoprotein diacylglyceryl transferase
MLIHWDASPIIFAIGPIALRWYSLAFLTGFTVAFRQFTKFCEWEGLPAEKMDSLLVYAVLGTTIGARLGHCLFYDPVYYFQHPLEIFMIWEGGLASHGGGLGVMTGIYLFTRKNPEFDFWWIFDRGAIYVVMTGALIRLGNLMNSEIIGKATDGSWGVIFDKIDQVPRHPTQIYESLCYFVIFLISRHLYMKKKAQTPKGLIFGFVIAAIFVCRFVIEYFKENQSSFEQGMIINMGQILSIPFVLVGIYLMVKAKEPVAVPANTAAKKSKKKR